MTNLLLFRKGARGFTPKSGQAADEYWSGQGEVAPYRSTSSEVRAARFTELQAVLENEQWSE